MHSTSKTFLQSTKGTNMSIVEIDFTLTIQITLTWDLQMNKKRIERKQRSTLCTRTCFFLNTPNLFVHFVWRRFYKHDMQLHRNICITLVHHRFYIPWDEFLSSMNLLYRHPLVHCRDENKSIKGFSFLRANRTILVCNRFILWSFVR